VPDTSVVSVAQPYFDRLRLVLDEIDVAGIEAFTQLLFHAWQDDRRVFLFGNGGSGYTASHYAMDLIKCASVPGQKRLQCFSLVDSQGLTTSISNDLSYDETFVYPLATHGRPGDLVVALSCSGNSPNVVNACRWARENGLTVVCISGFSGGRMADYADLHINVPRDEYGLVEDLHLSIGHVATLRLREQVQGVTQVR
jgi:D-sedoheptulose 7-phosphate isomerase